MPFTGVEWRVGLWSADRGERGLALFPLLISEFSGFFIECVIKLNSEKLIKKYHIHSPRILVNLHYI